MGERYECDTSAAAPAYSSQQGWRYSATAPVRESPPASTSEQAAGSVRKAFQLIGWPARCARERAALSPRPANQIAAGAGTALSGFCPTYGALRREYAFIPKSVIGVTLRSTAAASATPARRHPHGSAPRNPLLTTACGPPPPSPPGPRFSSPPPP